MIWNSEARDLLIAEIANDAAILVRLSSSTPNPIRAKLLGGRRIAWGVRTADLNAQSSRRCPQSYFAGSAKPRAAAGDGIEQKLQAMGVGV